MSAEKMIKSFEDACEFVLANKVCTIFGSKNSQYPSLWDNTDLPTEKPAGGGWSPRISAVWKWKTEIPNTFPDEIFYGKEPGGDAVLMEMSYLREVHYPAHHKPVDELGSLAVEVFELVRTQPSFTGDLRKRAVADFGCSKSQFETALKKLQTSLNIVRSTDPNLDRDQWLTFEEVHRDIVRQHEPRP